MIVYNRDYSFDSRYYGAVLNRKRIVGKATAVVIVHRQGTLLETPLGSVLFSPLIGHYNRRGLDSHSDDASGLNHIQPNARPSASTSSDSAGVSQLVANLCRNVWHRGQ